MYQRVYVKFLDTVNKREYVRVCSRKPRCKPMNSLRYSRPFMPFVLFRHRPEMSNARLQRSAVVLPAQERSDENVAGLDGRAFLGLSEPKASTKTVQAKSRAAAEKEEEMERGVCRL